MEFSTDIKFSSDLIENKNTTITYSGYLYKINSSSLKIVYGFGDNWMYTQEKEMEKTDHGFVATIQMLNFEKFNFCFKNPNNEWDNNYNSNFTAPISKPKIEEAFILNEGVVEGILNNLFEHDISQISNKIVEKSNEPQLEVVTEPELINNQTSPTTEQDNSFEVYFEKNEAIDISETIVNITSENSLNEDLDKEFLDLYTNTEQNSTSSEKQELLEEILSTPENSNSDKFDVNSFVDEVLEPITNQETLKQTEDTISQNEITNNIEESDDIFEDDNFETVSETTEEDKFNSVENASSDDQIDSIINDLINNLFEKTKSMSSTQKAETIDSVAIDNTTISEKTSETENTTTSQIIEENEPEASLIEEVTSHEDEIEVKPALINMDISKVYKFGQETGLIVSPRTLGKFYSFKKKVKLAFYKFFTAIPKILSSNFDEENDQ